MKLKKQTLIALAGLVWGAAGFNVLRIGVLTYTDYVSIVNFLLSLAVFMLFYRLVFEPLVRRHTARILEYTEEKQFFLKFFDQKSFLIMAVMMTFGIGLRASDLALDRFISVFYTGLGGALLLAGLSFLRNYFFAYTQREVQP